MVNSHFIVENALLSGKGELVIICPYPTEEHLNFAKINNKF